MQSAFVDIGLGRDAFLYVSDFFEDNDEYDKIVTSVEEKVLKLDRTPAPVAQAAPVEAAAPEAADAPAADAVAVPVDVPPAAPLSPPASAMQVPARIPGEPAARRRTGSRRRPGGRIAAAIGGGAGGDAARPALASRPRTAAAAGAACPKPSTIRRGPKGNRGTRRPGGRHSRSGSGGGSAAAAARHLRPGAGRFLRAAGRIAGQVHAARRRGSAGCESPSR